MLVTSNFSFSHSVFKRLVLQTRKNQDLFEKGFNVAKIMISPCDRVENIVGKGENAGYQSGLCGKQNLSAQPETCGNISKNA